jgi:AcrR family transcriptional regulator
VIGRASHAVRRFVGRPGCATPQPAAFGYSSQFLSLAETALDRPSPNCERVSLINKKQSSTAGPAALSIRERRRAVTSDAIRDAAIEVASEVGYAAMTTEKIAERAGVSPSTVYRYFADRDDLLAAITAWASQQTRIALPRGADEIADIQEEFMAGLDANRAHWRAIIVARVGQKPTSTGRQQRLDVWRKVLEEVTDHLDPEEALLAKAVIVYLTGGLAWLTMTDESGLDGAQAGRAAAWAIRTLIADLRAHNEQAAPKGTAPQPAPDRERSS